MLFDLKPINARMKLDNIRIGDISYFSHDTWDLSHLAHAKTNTPSSLKVHFHFIHNDQMKLTAKLYAYHLLGKVQIQTVVGKINSSLRTFMKYASANNIHSFSEITRDVILDYACWLKKDYSHLRNYSKGNPLSKRFCFDCCQVLEDLIKVGQVKNWDVPETPFPKDLKPYELFNYGNEWKSNRHKSIPERIFYSILHAAMQKEKRILTKAGIIIQSQTGLRASELLSLKEGCIKELHGEMFLEVSIGKTEKGEPVKHKIICNELVLNAVRELENETAELRTRGGLKEIFLTKYPNQLPNRIEAMGTKIIVLTVHAWFYRLKRFIQEHNIRDVDGNLYPLKSHQFRSTFTRHAILSGKSIPQLMKHFRHKTPEMTNHYLQLQNKDLKRMYVDTICNPESKLAGRRADQIKSNLKNLFRGKTETEINDIVTGLSQNMNFNPLPSGICLYDSRMAKCTESEGCFFYNCSNFLTEKKFYPVLKKQYDLLGANMERAKELGRQRDWQRAYVEYRALEPLVMALGDPK